MIREIVLPRDARIKRNSICNWKVLQNEKVLPVFGRYISRQDYDIILKAQDMGIIDYTKVFAENKILEYLGKDGAFVYFNKKEGRIKELKSIQGVIEDDGESEPTVEEESSPEGELAELVRQLGQAGGKKQ